MRKGAKRSAHRSRPNAPAPAGIRQSLLILGMLSLLVFAAYGNSLYAGFVFDDHSIIVNNPLIRSLTKIPALFGTGYWDREGYQTDQLYRPLVMATYAFNHSTSGLNALVYHLTNLILHLAVCWTLYGLGRQLGLSLITAFAGSALFAVHPIGTEAVTGIVGRAELMMALGVLLAIVFDIKRNPMNQPATRVSTASTLAFCGALLSKEQAVMLPVLLLICNAIRHETDGATWLAELKRGRNRYLVWVAVLVTYLLLRHALLTGVLPSGAEFVENPLAHADFLTRVMTATKVAGYYLWLVVWPAKLAADYSYNAIPMVTSLWSPGALLGTATWAAVCAVGILALRRRDPPLAIGISIAVLFFFPVSNWVAVIGTIMGERLFYLPLAGLCLALGAGLERVRVSIGSRELRVVQGVAIGAFGLMITSLTLRTIERNRDWTNDFTLFQSAVEVNPQAAKARLLLGSWLARQGRGDEALAELAKAKAIYPGYPLRHTFAEEMGNLLLAAGRTDEAFTLLEKALSVSPDHPALLHVYGLALQNREQWDEAEASHERALQVTREVSGERTLLFVNGLYNLARAYAFQSKTLEADNLLKEAMEIIDTSLTDSLSSKDVARFVAFRVILLTTQQDYRSAQPLFTRLLSIIETSANPGDFRFLSQPLESFARYLHETNQGTEARRVEQQLERISRSR